MKIKIAIVDSRIPQQCEKKLYILGFKVLKLPRCDALSDAVSSHTDMLICRIRNELITYADYAEKNDWLFSELWDLIKHSGARISCVSDEIIEKYPLDCRLNILTFGSKLFCKADTVSEYILRKAEQERLTVIKTKQGYPACTVLKLSDSHAVTADPGMAKILKKNGIDVSVIDNGGILLPPHKYGFIGGCAGVYNDTVYFLGNVEEHPSGKIILDACERCGLSAVSLSDGMLTDLGGILFCEGDIE